MSDVSLLVLWVIECRGAVLGGQMSATVRLFALVSLFNGAAPAARVPWSVGTAGVHTPQADSPSPIMYPPHPPEDKSEAHEMATQRTSPTCGLGLGLT